MEILNNITFDHLKTFILENNVIGFIVIVIITILLARFVKRLANRMLDQVTTNHGKTNYLFFRHVVVAMIYAVGFTTAIYTVPSFKAVGTTLLAGAGVFALAISFASQQALSNIVSGIFIIVFKPFKIGDRISMKSTGFDGIIEDVTLRHTVIRNYENRRIIVPNSIISDETIINSDYVDPRICRHMVVGIGYKSDISLALKIVREECEKHPYCIDNRSEEDIENNLPKVTVRVVNLGDSAIELKAFIWIQDQSKGLEMISDLYQSIKKRFDEQGIEIPYPHQTLEVRQIQ